MVWIIWAPALLKITPFYYYPTSSTLLFTAQGFTVKKLKANPTSLLDQSPVEPSRPSFQNPTDTIIEVVKAFFSKIGYGICLGAWICSFHGIYSQNEVRQLEREIVDSLYNQEKLILSNERRLTLQVFQLKRKLRDLESTTVINSQPAPNKRPHE